MKRLMLVLGIAFALSTVAAASDIAISTQANWWSQDVANVEMQKIADNVTDASVEQFTADDEAALADWVLAHTGDGKSDLLILCGKLPSSIYPGGNAQPDGSIIEEFLDDGNAIINTGDWMFYVGTTEGFNNDLGMVNIMDLSTMTSRWDDNVPVTVTAEGQLYCPSLVDFITDRAMHMDLLQNDWEEALSLALAADGVRADPGIVRNAYTGGLIGIFYEVNNEDDLPRGEVISEWINNWYLPIGSSSPYALREVPKTGSVIDETTVTLEWKTGDITQLNAVYFSTNLEEVSEGLIDAIVTPMTSLSTADIAGYADGLVPGTTYYWRVDQIGTDGQIYAGDVWSFLVRPLKGWNPTPADGAIYVVPNATLTWEPGLDAMAHFLAIGESFEDVNAVANGGGTPILGAPQYMATLEAGKTYYWRVDAMAATGMTQGDIWSFETVPAVEISDPNLVGWWPLDEGVGTTAVDWSGYGNHATLIGNVAWTNGFVGGAVAFDGTYGSYVDGGSAGADLGNDFTLAAWGKLAPNTAGNYGGIGGRLTSNNGYFGFAIVRHSSNVYRLWVGDSTGDLRAISSDATYTDTEWHHVAGVREGQTNALYVDGVRQSAPLDSAFVNTDQYFHLGKQYTQSTDRTYIGVIDDVRLYDEALTDEDIASLIAGDSVYFERFDAYEAGSEMHGQGGWKGWDNTASAGGLATDVNDPVGPGSVAILGSSDLVHEFDVTGGVVELSAMQYIPSGTTGTTMFILLNTYNDAGVNDGAKDWSIQTSFNLETGEISTWTGLTDAATIVYDQWIQLQYVIDMDNNTVNEYYNGTLIDTRAWDPEGEHNTLQAVDLYGAGASTVYYDDIVIR